MGVHKTVYEDTLVNIARDYNLGFVELRAANPSVDPWIPGAGREIILPSMHLLPKAPREGIVINLPEMRLYGFIDRGAPPVTHPIGVGRLGLSTPMGQTKVMRKVVGPTWRPTPRMREEKPELPEAVTPGMDNPMGTHALYLGWPEYAIHGTNKPFGIGRRSSSGCIRMYPEDIVKMYDTIDVGAKVTVVDQPVKVEWIGDELYLEAHPTLSNADKIEQEGGYPAYEMSQADLKVIADEAGEYADRLDWREIRRLMRERPGYPVIIASKYAAEVAAAAPEEIQEIVVPEEKKAEELAAAPVKEKTPEEESAPEDSGVETEENPAAEKPSRAVIRALNN